MVFFPMFYPNKTLIYHSFPRKNQKPNKFFFERLGHKLDKNKSRDCLVEEYGQVKTKFWEKSHFT